VKPGTNLQNKNYNRSQGSAASSDRGKGMESERGEVAKCRGELVSYSGRERGIKKGRKEENLQICQE
jgi:hypothetical protein